MSKKESEKYYTKYGRAKELIMKKILYVIVLILIGVFVGNIYLSTRVKFQSNISERLSSLKSKTNYREEIDHLSDSDIVSLNSDTPKIDFEDKKLVMEKYETAFDYDQNKKALEPESNLDEFVQDYELNEPTDNYNEKEIKVGVDTKLETEDLINIMKQYEDLIGSM